MKDWTTHQSTRGWKPPIDTWKIDKSVIICPLGHTESFQQYAINTYSCNSCCNGNQQKIFMMKNGEGFYTQK